VKTAADCRWNKFSPVAELAGPKQLRRLLEAVLSIGSELGLDEVLQRIVEAATELVDARYGALAVLSEDGQSLSQFITVGIDEEERRAIGDLPRGHGILGLLILDPRPIRLPDLREHPDSYGFPPNHPPMRSFLGVPVVLKGRAIGNFYLTDKVEAPEFSEDDQRLVEMFSAHAAIAIENARLHEQVRRLAVVDERARISRDLHDGIIQSLYAVSLSLEDVGELMDESPTEAEQRVDRAIDAIQTTIRDLRNFIFGLRPELLDSGTLVESLRALADEVAVNAVVEVAAVLDPVAAQALDDESQGELLQVAREALSNVARHSGATQASVELRSDGRDTILVVADNGRGFDPDADRSGRHQGLGNIRRRVDAIGGRLLVESSAGSGARIIVRVARPDELAAIEARA